MPTLNTFFEVYCSVCGHGLCDHTKTPQKERGKPQRVEIAPCPRCLLKAVKDKDFDEQVYIESLYK
jgi:hypothetical protein